jgi:hypothetical protein
LAIRYIRQKDINYSLWDRCISNSLNGLVYGYSWYLDIIAQHWDALVEDDYRSVMPLIHKERLFYKKTYTPLLSGQLGIFSMKPVTSAKIEIFLKAIPYRFRKLKICFNRQNSLSIKNCFPCKSVKSYELDLITPYERKSDLYTAAIKSGISIAKKNKLSVNKGLSLAEFQKFVAQNENQRPANDLLNPLQHILSLLIGIGKGEIIAVFSSDNILISVACFITSNQNVIMLYALSNDQGVEEKANYLIMDSFLRNYSSRNVTLSIDYLDKSWNKELFRDFDALESHYLCYSENRFPLLFRWL